MADDPAAYDEGNNKPMVWTDPESGVTHYRASALGGCTTAMMIVRSGFEPLAPPKSMQDRFNEGHLHEPDIVRRANTEYGLEVFALNPETKKQWEVVVPVTASVVITGHTDGFCHGTMPDEDYEGSAFGEKRLFEAKTMSDAAFKRWFAMTWPQRWAAYPGYAKQLTVYLAGMSEMLGVDVQDWVYGIKNKESGQVILEAGTGHPFPLAAIKAQVLTIEANVRQGVEFPEVCHPRTQWPCPVYYMGPCGDQPARDTIDERTAEVVVTLATTYERAKQAEIIAKKAKETARDEIKKHLVGGSKPELPDGWKVAYTARESKGMESQTTVDYDRMRADHPEWFEEYESTTDVEKFSSERVVVTPPKDLEL